MDSNRSHLVEYAEPPLQDERKLARRLIQRVAIGKNLPTFEEDVLEWFFYKRAFEETSRKGEYSEEENILRLYESLKGTAKEDVALLMITTRSSQEEIDL